MRTGLEAAERVRLTFDAVYAFDRPAHDLELELRVRPWLDAKPGLVPIRLASEPEGCFARPEIDENGVAVDRFRLAGPLSRLRLNASFDHLVVRDAALPVFAPTKADFALEGLMAPPEIEPWPEALGRLRASWCYSDDPHRQPSTLPEIARLRSGSCEAVARLAVEIVRSQSIPARFVGGYRLAHVEGDVRMVRRHVWIAIWEGTRWRQFDPLASPEAEGLLVATAFGGRLSDIAVIKGSFKGAGLARLAVSAHAQREAPSS
ncbi:hypothetical protein LJR090_004419 [Bosea sp. LjRoot90]|uniref:transglutaminase-like domain-containing protein n=1 Tax=Bosea sp. LjRoot90 TaxID=3342342 RepID=UPI003ED15B1F